MAGRDDSRRWAGVGPARLAVAWAVAVLVLLVEHVTGWHYRAPVSGWPGLMAGARQGMREGRWTLRQAGEGRARQRGGGERARARLLPTLSAAGEAASDSYARVPLDRFDCGRAVKLAAFSFAVYGDPTNGRWLRCSDGTDIGFQSDELVRSAFKSLLQVHLLRARNLPEEQSLLERTLTGAECDPYVVTKVVSGNWSDTAVTQPKTRNRNPDFYERFFLWVQDPATAVLELTVKEKNLITSDEYIGYCEVPVTQLLGSDPEGEWSGWLDLEPFVPPELRKDKKKKAGWLDKLFKRGPREQIEVELSLIPLQSPDGEEEEEEEEEEAEGPRVPSGGGPRSVLEDIDWNVLGEMVGGEALGLGRYRLCCFLNNKETDTQGGVWVDRAGKVIIFSFRGTQISWKDLLTDLLIVQQPFAEGTPDQLVHSGFLRAFRSIEMAVHTALEYVTRGELDGWTVLCTGHSLGGALATLVAFDLAGRHPELCEQGRLAMYSYGAPRVGNSAFCNEYDRRLRDSSFRVVNNQDLVARMPRGASKPILEYDHPGRTVLLGETMDQIWVEDESPGSCPIREIKPFAAQEEAVKTQLQQQAEAQQAVGGLVPTLPSLEEQLKAAVSAVMTPAESSSGAGNGLNDMLKLPVSLATFNNGSAASVTDMLRVATNLTTLQAMLNQPVLDVSSILPSLPSFPQDVKSLLDANQTAALAARTLGLNMSFVDAEFRLLDSIWQGAALAHHMEPLYYAALQTALRDIKTRRSSGGGKKGA